MTEFVVGKRSADLYVRAKFHVRFKLPGNAEVPRGQM